MAKYNTYTTEQEKFLEEHSRGITRKELTNLFNAKFGTNKSAMSIKSWCNNRKLNCGDDGKFKNGNVSWQTGLSGEKYISHFTSESYARSIKHIAGKRLHGIGDIVIRRGEQCVITSIEPNTPIDKRVQVKNRYVYEQAYGRIPENHVIAHLDGNIMNCKLDNLYCIPAKYIAVMNKNHWFSKDPIITLTAIKWCDLFYEMFNDKKIAAHPQATTTNKNNITERMCQVGKRD